METRIVDLKNEGNGTIKASILAGGSFSFDYCFTIIKR
jgi:hypothetical protein